MKKVLLGALMLAGATSMAHAAAPVKAKVKAQVKFTEIITHTSCGTEYKFDSSQGLENILDTLEIMDEIDCG